MKNLYNIIRYTNYSKYNNLFYLNQTIKFNIQKKYFSFEQSKEKQKRHFILQYKYCEDAYYKTLPYKEIHNDLIQNFEFSGNIIIGGPFFPQDGALFIFTSNDEITVDSFVKKDPYYTNGIVEEYEIKELELQTKKRTDELALLYKNR